MGSGSANALYQTISSQIIIHLLTAHPALASCGGEERNLPGSLCNPVWMFQYIAAGVLQIAGLSLSLSPQLGGLFKSAQE